MPTLPTTDRAIPALYTFRRCPYAIRARMAIAAAGIAVTPIEVALRDKPAALVALSPKATVPVLHLTDGRVIEESLDIMRWALQQSDPNNWLASGAQSQTDDWLHTNDTVFKPLLDRYKYAGRHPALSVAEHRANALNAFIWPLEKALEGHAFMLGDQASLVDVALFPFVRQFAGVDAVWFSQSALGGVQRWLNGWLDSTLFKQVMTKPGGLG